MTLVNYVKLKDVDDAIRPLVININRIPGIYTQTTCEGHVWHECPAFPTKDGWIHFSKPKEQHDKLIISIDDYCKSNKLFSLTDWHQESETDQYTINAAFDAEHDEYQRVEILEKLNPKEKKEFWTGMDAQKPILISGWRDLNQVVVRYIKENITIDLFTLPYRNPDDHTDFRRYCGMCR